MMGECDLDMMGSPSKLNVTRNTVTLTRIFPTLDLRIEEKVMWESSLLGCPQRYHCTVRQLLETPHIVEWARK